MGLPLSDDDDWEQFCASEINSVLEQVEYIEIIEANPPRNLLEIALTKLSQIIEFSTHLSHIRIWWIGERLDPRLASTVCEALLHSTAQQKIKVEFFFGKTRFDDNFLPVANLMKNCKREIGLDISGAEMHEDETWKHFVDALRHLSGAVKELTLYSIDVGDDGACALAENLKVSTTLTCLDLSYNDIGVKGAKALAGALKHNSSVTKLSLACNSIGNDGAEALAGALNENGTLTELNLSRNSIGDDGAIALGEAIACNVTLDSLWLSFNGDITEEVGIEALANGLNRNSTLTVLCHSWEHTGIQFALRRNKALLKEAAWMERFSEQDVRLKSKILPKAMERYSMSDFIELTFLFLQRERATLLTQAESVVESGGPAPKKRRV